MVRPSWSLRANRAHAQHDMSTDRARPPATPIIPVQSWLLPTVEPNRDGRWDEKHIAQRTND